MWNVILGLGKLSFGIAFTSAIIIIKIKKEIMCKLKLRIYLS
jgi:hypothetical protein